VQGTTALPNFWEVLHTAARNDTATKFYMVIKLVKGNFYTVDHALGPGLYIHLIVTHMLMRYLFAKLLVLLSLT